MQFIFLDMAGKTLFIRDDAERAQWTVEEKKLDLEFPYREDKAVSIGQQVYFRDPSTGDQQIYEIKTVKTVQPEAYQQITAEHICISELTDEHMEKRELTDATCSAALGGVLSGTLWNVGTVSVNPVASADLERGSVWQAVLNIQTNWNVYIIPRVTLSYDGTITRYLDIKSTDGEWNGIRFSIDKNFLDPSVTYDDTELVTALYGYGGTIINDDPTAENQECNFADVVWTQTADHPAKPAGQTYLEDPAATAAYGRNGRKRFGYYQNMDVTDPETLLELTWEALKKSSTPAISIEGSVADLYRLGYADQPIRLHDIALVEVLPAGFKKQIQIIRLNVDLLDGSSTSVTIGEYIPNIVYINRDTTDNITGTRGGGRNKNSATTERHEFETAIESIDAGTGLRFRAFQNDLDDMDNELKLQEGRITVTYNKVEQEVVDRRNADGILSGRITVEANRITQEVTRATGAESGLAGRITTQENKISLVVEETAGGNVIKAASIVASVNDSGSNVAISADHVSITGSAKLSGSFEISDGNLRVKKSSVFQGNITLTTSGSYVQAPNFTVNSGGHIRLVGEGYYDITYSGYSALYKDLQIVLNGNTYTLQKKSVSDNNWVDVGSFSRATSLSGEWSGETYKVTASPQGNQFTVPMPMRLNGTTAANDFSAEIYESTAGSTVARKSIYGYLIFTENGASSWVDVNTKRDGTGTAVARISVGSLYTPETSEIGFDQLSIQGSSASISGRTNAGALSKTSITAPGYLFFRVGCRGTRKLYYITINP